MDPSATATWYSTLQKPFFAPPPWVFGPVWMVLYVLIALSFGYTFWKVLHKSWPTSVAVPFVWNLVFNFAFSPIQFGLQSNVLATVDAVCILLTLVWAMKNVRPYSKAIYVLQIPYLLWVCFATVLSVSITWLNW